MRRLRVDGAKVRTWLGIRGMTQLEAAKLAGIATSTLTNLKDSESWKSDTVVALADVLDVHPYDLLTAEGFPPPHVGAPAVALAS